MEAMQVAVSCAAPAPLSMASRSCRASRSRQRAGVPMLGAFGGLKADSKVTTMGQVASTEVEFSRVQAMCRAGVSGVSRGGAATSRCDAGAEIIRIIPIMSGLVLVGIAIGFVLLRVEAAVEESE